MEYALAFRWGRGGTRRNVCMTFAGFSFSKIWIRKKSARAECSLLGAPMVMRDTSINIQPFHFCLHIPRCSMPLHMLWKLWKTKRKKAIIILINFAYNMWNERLLHERGEIPNRICEHERCAHSEYAELEEFNIFDRRVLAQRAPFAGIRWMQCIFDAFIIFQEWNPSCSVFVCVGCALVCIKQSLAETGKNGE